MAASANARILAYEGKVPRIDPSAFIADGAVVIGDVTVGPEASVWFNAVLRGDNEPIVLGEGSNVQDGAVVHTDPGFACTVGARVTVGHNAILHGCTIADGATVGMGATVLNGARVGQGALVAAGALVLEEAEVAAGWLVAGVPAKPRRELTAEDAERFRRNSEGYVRRSRIYAMGGGSPT